MGLSEVEALLLKKFRRAKRPFFVARDGLQNEGEVLIHSKTCIGCLSCADTGLDDRDPEIVTESLPSRNLGSMGILVNN